MGRRTKTLLPTSTQLLIPKTIKPEIVQNQLQQQQSRQKSYYDKKTKQLPKLNKGDSVKIQSKDGKWRPATITRMANTPRSYLVTTPEGSTYRRNRRHINKDQSKEEAVGYLSDDDDTDPRNTSDSSTGDISDDSPAEESAQLVRNPSNGSSSTPVRRSTRNVRRPARYNDTWSLHS